MEIMSQVHNLIIEMEGENLQIVPKSTLVYILKHTCIYLPNFYNIIIGCLRLLFDLSRCLSAVAKMLMHKMAEIEKDEVEFPVCHLVAKGFNIRWQHIKALALPC